MQPYNFTQPDQDLGALIVRPNGTILVFSVDVVADPCPDIIWSFNSIRLGPSNKTFTYNNVCTEAGTGSPTWTFTLNVTLTAATSGNYSASFTNIAGTAFLPKTYLTISGTLKFISSMLEYDFMLHACPQSLLLLVYH